MKTIKTNGIYHLSPVGNSHIWYWGTDHTGGDLYEAAELYKARHPFSKNRAVYVRFPEGRLIEPVIAKEGQYFGVPSLYHADIIYTLLVDFPQNEIHILAFNPDEVLDGAAVQTVAILPLWIADDCYNLLLKTAPVMLTRQSSDNYFQILWTEANGLMDIGFQIKEHESFSHAEGEILYFHNWWEKEEPVYEYHEETISRNLKGEILERINGGIFEVHPQKYWILE
ncbi:hypothetical protein [Bacilliculturomica massiliensis]|uniref:hypothetical protein n=1 Tax=Bacilliculturomica massiliensis TaxID=1917867 RepID=UPI001032207B|nr:hypothetical protein [Bacilliculturomica massiliensis]